MLVYKVEVTVAASRSHYTEVLGGGDVPPFCETQQIVAEVTIPKFELIAIDAESLLTRLSGPLATWLAEQRRRWELPRPE